MSKPLVSVVMPSYNSEKHIAESIQSIIDQTFTDWEFIIVDGHSKDKTIEIIQNFMTKDSRIKLMFDEGKGIGPALNMGCEAAQGKYIARMDTDDISLPERLEKEVQFLDNHPRSVLVSCSAQYINEDGDPLGYMFPYTHKHHLMRNMASVVHPGVLMRKDVFRECGGYPPINRSEDLMLWYKMAHKGDINIIEYPYLQYRLSVGALSNTMSNLYLLEVGEKWKKYSETSILTNEQLQEINSFINENVLNVNNRVNPVSRVENGLYKLIRKICSKKVAIKSVFILKNLYGYIKK